MPWARTRQHVWLQTDLPTTTPPHPTGTGTAPARHPEQSWPPLMQDDWAMVPQPVSLGLMS